jgi:RHS repeat-associated protein
MAEQANVASDALALPKGGGSLQGLGESFSANLFTGTGNLTIPLQLSHGRQGFSPTLKLDYSTGGANGAFGLGWMLGASSIRRKTDNGVPQYDESDVFLLSGADELILRSDRPTRVEGDFVVVSFRPRTEGLFARIERWQRTQGEGPADWSELFWRVTTKDGVSHFYGRRLQSVLFDPESRKQSEWRLELSYDTRGNVVLYEYKREDRLGIPDGIEERHRVGTQLYLKRIRYGNVHPLDIANPEQGLHQQADDAFLFSVLLDYGEHGAVDNGADVVNDDIYLERRAWSVRPDPFSSCRAGFEVRTYRRCARVIMLHHKVLGEAGPVPVRSYEIKYQQSAVSGVSLLHEVTVTGYRRSPNQQIKRCPTAQAGHGGVQSLDFELASLPPLSLNYSAFNPDAQSFRAIEARGNDLPPQGLGDSTYALVDLFGSGLPDVVELSEERLRYWRNLGFGLLDRPRTMPSAPPVALSSEGIGFGDMTGNGRADLLIHEGSLWGFYELTGDAAWHRFTPYESRPSFSLSDPHIRFADMTGDGRSDALRADAEELVLFPGQGEKGFGAPIRVARVHDLDLFPDLDFANDRVFLADLNGDGLKDIVLVHAGRIDYWPNLGWGRFGCRITMARSPSLPADFDPKRILFADLDGSGPEDLVYVESGFIRYWMNCSGNGWSEQRRVNGTPLEDSAVRATDFLGTGSTGLLWSGSRVIGVASYGFLDFTGGVKPYLLSSITSSIGSETLIEMAPSTRFVADELRAGRRWAGYLPFPVQVVSRLTTIDRITGTGTTHKYRYAHGVYDGRQRRFAGFARVDTLDTEQIPVIREHDNAAYVPPLLSRTWYHVGVPDDDNFSLAATMADCWEGDPQAFGAAWRINTADSAADAYLSLRGARVRSETFVLDGSTEEAHPLSVVEVGFQVLNLQLRGDAHAGVFHSTTLESLTYNYERQPLDPRVGHQIVVEIDEMGHALKTLNIVYPRRSPVYPEQAESFITCDRMAFLNVDLPNSVYRIGTVVSEEKFELAVPRPLPGRVTLSDVLAWDIDRGAHRCFSHRRYYYDGPPYVGLPLAQVGAHGLLTRSESLVFDTGTISTLYGAKVSAADLAEVGLAELPAGSDRWWRQDARSEYGGRFLQPLRVLDPLGGATVTNFDAFELLPVESIDGLNNRHSVENDPWTLCPIASMDANGNRSCVVFDPLGLVIATVIGGKQDDPEGDTIDQPTTSVQYDLHAYWRSRVDGTRPQPCMSRTLQRMQHVSAANNSLMQEVVTYLDGMGRQLQTKTRAEPEAASPSIARWVGSGWQIRNNKGWVISDFEPFFSANESFEPDRREGVATVTTYDALGRVVHKRAPDGSLSRVAYGAWSQTTHDANDTCQEGTWYTNAMEGDLYSKDAATKAASHVDTPTVLHLDPLNRCFMSVEDGGAAVGRLVTRTRFDIQNNPLEIVDPNGLRICQMQYSLLKHVIVRQHVDSGLRRVLLNAAGDPARRWDDRSQVFDYVYDVVRRLVQTWVTDSAGVRRLVESTTFGESHPQARDRNLRGQPFERRDTAGITRFLRYDFKGNTLESELSLLADPTSTPDWNANVDGVFTSDSPLQVENSYDALNRVVAARMPDGSVYRHTYNLGGLSQRIEVTPAGQPTVAVMARADSDARGRRLRTAFGNGMTTHHGYDPLTQRLVMLKSTIGAADIQSLHFSHDAAGNLTSARDDVAEIQFFGNAQVSADRFYAYDALYRMTEARGREHAITAAVDEHAVFNPVYASNGYNDLQAVRRYVESYRYDGSGNLLAIRHHAVNGTWTRGMNFLQGSNRLVEINPGKTLARFSFQYDNHGNVQAVPAAQLTWNHRDRIVEADIGGGGHAWYQYDGTGRRVRKVVRFQNGFVREFIYVGHLEYEREYASWAAFQIGAIHLQQTRLQVLDGGHRICLIDTLTVSGGVPITTPASEYRYQLQAETGSSTIEIDASGEVLSVEEYYPLGTSAYTAYLDASRLRDKRYRFAGQEYDAETGLYLVGARHYASWLGRWTSCDPAGEAGGINPYAYVGNRFVNRSDSTGRWDSSAFADELVGHIDEAEKSYLLENANVGTSLWNTVVAMTAMMARGSTSIFKVGAGAAQGVEQIRNAEDGWDYAIGVSRILSDAGEIASASLGLAGATAKAAQTVQVARMERQLKVLQTQRAAASGKMARELSDQIGVLQAEKLATKAGLADQGPMNILSKQGAPTRNGVDKAFSGAKPFSKSVNVVAETKARAALPGAPTDMLSTARGNVQGSATYNVERITTAATSGNADAAKMIAKMRPAGTHESYLIASEISVGSQPQVFRLQSAGGALPTAMTSGLPNASPFQTMFLTTGATVAAQGSREQ